jgi:four helix bundle protein
VPISREGPAESDGEFGRFLHIAIGSASELEYHLFLARDLSILPPKDYEPLSAGVEEVKRMLASLVRSLKN